MMKLAGVRIMSTFNILYRVFMEIVRAVEGVDMGKIQPSCYVRYGIFGLRLSSALPPCPLRAQRTSKNSQQQESKLHPKKRSPSSRAIGHHPQGPVLFLLPELCDTGSRKQLEVASLSTSACRIRNLHLETTIPLPRLRASYLRLGSPRYFPHTS
jgi:hypothetical protein